MTEKTWQGHSVPRHSDQDLVGDINQVKATIEQASRARRSTDPNIGQGTCIYERFIEGTNLLMRIPVLFDYPTYDQGQLLGKALTAFMLDEGQWDSGQVGEIFWTANEEKKENE